MHRANGKRVPCAEKKVEKRCGSLQTTWPYRVGRDGWKVGLGRTRMVVFEVERLRDRREVRRARFECVVVHLRSI